MTRHQILSLALVLGLGSCEKAKHELADVIESKLLKDTPGAPVETPSPAAQPALVRALTTDEYDAFIATPGLVVVDFYADWCGPCKELGPVLEKVVEEHQGKVLLGKVDADQNKELAARLGVKAIPDVRIFKDGVQIDRFEGSMPEPMLKEKMVAWLGGAPAVVATPQPQPQPQPQPVKPQPQKPKPETAQGKPDETKPEEPKQTIAPMTKDWLPPGVQRK